MKIFLLVILFVGVKSEFSRRIYGGDRIDMSEAPYSVAIFDGNRYICTGSLISKNFVLTAAHCLEERSADYKIRAGSEDKLSGGVLVNVNKFSIHPEYDLKYGHDNDFALLRLESGTEFPETVKCASLPDDNDVIKTGEMMMIAGWGRTPTGESSQILLGAEVPIYDFKECSKAYRKKLLKIMEESMICAGFEDGEVDTCQGKN